MRMQTAEVGTVVSTMEGPSPSSVDFVVSAENKVHRGQFIELDYSEGTMVCMINDLQKTNRYFERAESVKEFESNGRALFEQFPVLEWEYLLAKTRPLGVISKEGKIKRPSFPAGPGTKVRVASNETLKKILHFDEQKGLEVGELEFHDLKVKLSMTRLFQKHLAILAQSGSGKSYSVSVMLEELLDRPKENGRIAAVMFDTHGEYSSFAEPQTGGKKDYSSKTVLIPSRTIKIGVPKLSAGDFAALLPGISAPQRRDLGKAISKLKDEMKAGFGPYSLTALTQEVLKNEEGKKTAASLSGWLFELQEMRLFEETDSFSLQDVIKPGVLTIIDLSAETSAKRKQIIVSYFLRKMFYQRREKKLPPFAAIIEEAHNYAPEGVKFEQAMAKGIIETIAREGRKFGASICLISQRPKRLSTTALAQCNTHIILRITNPYDIKHLAESSEGIDSASERMITSLRVGEALIVGEAVGFPIFFKVRERKSAESRHEVSLEKAALDFEDKKEKEIEEAEEFL